MSTKEDASLQPFVEQSLDRLDQIEKDLIRLEKKEYPDPDSITRIYSTVLAIKESASLNALDNIKAVSEKLGNVMDRLFRKEIALDEKRINTIIETFDRLTEIVSNASHSQEFDISPILQPLDNMLSSEPGMDTAKKKTETEPSQPKAQAKAPAAKPVRKSRSADEFKKRFGITEEIDLYSNSNPLGVSKAVSLAMERMAASCNAFEENHLESLKFGLSQRHELAEDKIVLANGAIEILDLLLRISVTPGQDHILSYVHGLPEYSSVAALCGVELLRLPRSRNYAPPLDQIVSTADENTAAIIITNPDIPSGYGIPGEEIATMVNLLPERTLLIVDERGIEFSWPEDDYTALHYLDKAPNLIVLRSFSWSFGLKGLRLGYGLMSSELATVFEESRLPQPISPVNLGAGLAAISHTEFYYSTIALIIRGRERLQKGLEEAGCTVYPSQNNFVMFAPPIPTATFHKEMLARGFHLRKLDDFGLSDLMTVSVGNHSCIRMFLAAVKDIL